MARHIDDLARAHHAYVPSDGAGFRRAARVLQALWRERQGLPIGLHHGRPLGSRLERECAERSLANYLTPAIRAVLRETLANASPGQLFARPRIYDDLLSSQPLCFNLFGELACDLALAGEVFQALSPGKAAAVTGIRFEHSPGRSDARFTGDRSAFDVFVDYTTPRGERGFLGIEVKYHEDMMVPPAPHRARYDEIAAAMGCFKLEAREALKRSPLEQLWRDHLLAGSMLAPGSGLGYAEGAFVLLYPAANPHCRAAAEAYPGSLRGNAADTATFDAWTLEDFVSILSFATPAPWVEELRRRYLGFEALREEAA